MLGKKTRFMEVGEIRRVCGDLMKDNPKTTRHGTDGPPAWPYSHFIIWTGIGQ